MKTEINVTTGEVVQRELTEEEEAERLGKYNNWLAGEPERQRLEEIKTIKSGLREVVAWQFRMILELFEVGRANGMWINTDFSEEIRAKAIEWKQKLNRLTELDE
jgi:hypothetical protein